MSSPFYVWGLDVNCGMPGQAAGVSGSFVAVHGVGKSMRMAAGAADFAASEWNALASGLSNAVFVGSSEKELAGVSGAKVVASTPAQLAALVDLSKGVVCTNTAALQLARTMRKPTVAIMDTAVAAKFTSGTKVPPTVVASPSAAASAAKF